MFSYGLSSRLRAARAAVKMTQLSVADELGCHPLTVASWERGRTEPNASMLGALADLYDVTADWLIRGKVPEVAQRP